MVVDILPGRKVGNILSDVEIGEQCGPDCLSAVVLDRELAGVSSRGGSSESSESGERLHGQMGMDEALVGDARVRDDLGVEY
jgi:hypothetical protein